VVDKHTFFVGNIWFSFLYLSTCLWKNGVGGIGYITHSLDCEKLARLMKFNIDEAWMNGDGIYYL